MTDYCHCKSRWVDLAFLKASLVYCSNCDKPVCCDAVDHDAGVGRHPAEIANDEHFACWRHWDMVVGRTPLVN